MFRQCNLAIASVIAVGLVAGCGGKSHGPERAAIHGHVTLDGKDIMAGSIIFSPTGGGKGQPAGGMIKDGQYTINADQGPSLGTQSVEIRSERKTGKKVQAAMRDRGELMDETVEAIPAQFNQRTKLTCEVKSGDNEANFDLQSR
jgi:hypothetical protein